MISVNDDSNNANNLKTTYVDSMWVKKLDGLYDENYNLLSTYNELVSDYGLNVQKDYTEDGNNGYLTENSGSFSAIDYYNDEFYDKFQNYSILILPNNITKIGNYALAEAPLTYVILSNNVTSIGDNAFEFTAIKSIIIPSNVSKIGQRAFYECIDLENVKFKNTTGWFVADSTSATSGNNINVTNPEINADNLVNTYNSKYWKRN